MKEEKQLRLLRRQVTFWTIWIFKSTRTSKKIPNFRKFISLNFCFYKESAQGQQASQEALRAKRNQEATEREWRRKEREEQSRREENEARMKAAREKQIKQKEHFQAVQADRERQVRDQNICF